MGAVRAAAVGLGTLSGIAAAGVAAASARFYLGRRRADEEWTASRYSKLGDPGTVKRLNILPLVDFYASRDDLVGEPGVSYLVRADDTTILFDAGLNWHRESPSPLLRNLTTLGLDLADLDAVVLSHPHQDHMGGQHGRLVVSPEPVDLRGIPAYVPAPVEVPSARVVVVTEPMQLAPGVVTTGPIVRQDFVLGRMVEQSLAVNVDGKGVVVLVGCGHPTVQRIVESVEALFGGPIYGLVGGLHYPVTASRLVQVGLPLQRIVGTGKWPWRSIGRSDVEAAIAFVQHRQPGLVALSPHDSCDWSLEVFRSAFGKAYSEVLVGKEIIVG